MFFTLKNCYDDYKEKKVDSDYSLYMSVELTILLILFFFSLGYAWYFYISIPFLLWGITLYIKSNNNEDIEGSLQGKYKGNIFVNLIGNADVHMFLTYWALIFNFLIISFFYPIDISVLLGFIVIVVFLYAQYEIVILSKRKIMEHSKKYGWTEDSYKQGIGFLPVLFVSLIILIITNYVVYGRLILNTSL